MPGFKIHISASTAIGIGYGVAATTWYGVPWESSVLAGGVCSLGGMVPDIDLDTGTPLKESLGFGAAIVSMMMLQRYQHVQVSHEMMVLSGVAGYLLIRFGLGAILKHFTVHRGMFHSVPVCLFCGELVFLASTGSWQIRCFKACGIMIGFMSHLILDEIWSLDPRHLRVKSSFGTALKFYGESPVSNAITYLVTAIATVLAFNDDAWVDSPPQTQELHQLAESIVNSIAKR